MFNKILALAIITFFVIGAVSGWRMYSQYKQRQAERVAQMQQKVEEVTLTTIEGWTVKDIAAEVEEKGLASKDAFLAAATNFDFQSYTLINKPAKTSLEGYLFPDTYRIAKNSSIETIIGKMLDNFSARVKTIGVSPSKDNYVIPGYEELEIVGGDNKPGMSLYDVIVMASVIEKESGGKGTSANASLSLEQERALVASVFYNRLAIGQALESDATVNYVTGKNTPAASAQDLEVNSRYNTYKYPGLPPGPICNPSLGSIRAALQPAESEYYYFLHKQPSGRVEFSKTFEEHVQKKLGQ